MRRALSRALCTLRTLLFSSIAFTLPYLSLNDSCYVFLSKD